MAGVRRLLEEDLKLHKNTLDPFKKYINEQLDEVSKVLEKASCNLYISSQNRL